MNEQIPNDRALVPQQSEDCWAPDDQPKPPIASTIITLLLMAAVCVALYMTRAPECHELAGQTMPARCAD